MADLAKPEYVSCTETSVTISTAGGEGVTVEYKEYPEDWSAAKSVEAAAEWVDLVQVGSRNMSNFALLKAIGNAGSTLLLKRGVAATLKEWRLAAEHALHAGAQGVIFCERGIKGFDPETRNTLDLSGVALLSAEGHTVMVDPSPGVGRRDLVATMGRAALAVGCAGLLVEAHTDAQSAMSDGPQALNAEELNQLAKETQAVTR